MKLHRLFLSLLMFAGGVVCNCLPLGAQTQTPAQGTPNPPIAIHFSLQQPGFVTLVIEDASGKRVRNLISETPFPAGENTTYWDGLDDLGRDTDSANHAIYHVPGQFVAPGTYSVRGLVRPKIGLSYQMTPYFGAAHLPWATKDRSSEWLTNHTPPSAVQWIPAAATPKREGQPTSAGPQILVGSAVAEGGSGLAWLDPSGHKVYGQMWLGGVWTGAPFIARDMGIKPVPGIYAYTASAWEGALRLNELKSQLGAAPGDTRVGSGDDAPVLAPNWKFPGAEGAAWNNPGTGVAVSGLAAYNGLIAVSLPQLNQLLFVDGRTRRALGTMPQRAPRGLAFDRQGRLLVLSAKTLLRYTLPSNIPDFLSRPLAPEGESLSREKWRVTASTQNDNAFKAIDRAGGTRWESGEGQHPGATFTLDLGEPQFFTRIALESYWPPDWGRGYEIAVSDDGKTFGDPIAKGEGKPDLLSIEVPRTKARYLRITQTGQANNQWAINEITLFDRAPDTTVAKPKPMPAPQTLATNLDDPQQIVVAPSGNLFISTRGQSHNIKVLDSSGKLARAIGTPGAPKQGPYDAAHMNNPAGITLDDRGRLWVAEEDFQPKRVSIWNAATGKLIQAFYGPQRYGGGGEIDPRDSTTYYYDGMTFKLDYAKATSVPTTIYFRPEKDDPFAGPDTHGRAPQTPLYFHGALYMTNAHNLNPTGGTSIAGLWRMEGGIARPVAAMGAARDFATFQPLLRGNENFSARWSGQVQVPTTGDWTFIVASDDDSRLTINGQKLIDQRIGESRGVIHLEAGRRYDLSLEYQQGVGGASVHLSWENAAQQRQIVPATALFASKDAKTAGGLTARYYDGHNFETLKATHTDPTIDFNWNDTPPDALRPANTSFLARLPPKFNPRDRLMFAWSDANGDAQMQPTEVTFKKVEGDLGGVTVMDDGSFVFSRFNEQSVQFAPVGFTTKGAPRYDLNAAKVLVAKANGPVSSGGDQVLVGENGWTLHTNAPQPYSPYGIGGAKNGEPMWSYPSMWPGLHASHIAPTPEFPGELIGTTRLLGNTVKLKGDAGELIFLNGNKGNIYTFTTDGLFVATLFKDSREASWTFPEAKPGMDVSAASEQEESFWPFVTQTQDGQVMLSVNGSLLRANGFDAIKRLPPQTLQVTADTLKQAQTYFVQREAARQAAKDPGPMTVAIRPDAPVVDGKLGEWANAQFVTIDTRQQQEGDWGRREMKSEAALAVSGERLYAAFRADDANLLRSQPQSLTNLFKGGGALDLMLGNVEGGQRLLVTRTGEGDKAKTTAMLYRVKDPQAGTEPTLFISSIGNTRTVRIDRVQDVSDQITLAQDGLNYELSVPLALLRLAPQSGQSITGDIGLLRGNGFQNLQRVYWHNKASGLVSDLASEAELLPNLWGQLQFKTVP
ncbi:hypothetical protein EON83_04250 [bacterium]|nr:MAG: hypothetical protein EON83_04250 [bacterium]